MGRAAGILGALVVMLVAAPSAWAQEPTVPFGVTVAGVDVGAMTEAQATEALRAFFAQPLRLAFGASTLAVPRDRLGARARIARAVDAALVAAPGTALTLGVAITDWKLRLWLKRRAKTFDRAPVSSRARLVGAVPRLTKAAAGRTIVRRHARIRLLGALRNHRQDAVTVPIRTLKPAVTANRFGPAIVIRRGSKRLTLFRSAGAGPMKVQRTFPIATGMAAYPTPLGSFTIARMARNPWWYPPKSDWAKGAKPIPPGPGNPLGTRWMGLSVGGVGIHGTPDAASIGYSASHGCIRMRIPAAEWLFERVRLGTPVFIVAS
ncbi:MAG TPA: L,D-transpeptidase [Gaiellaceae bacterium]|nr:L,D-transpeptidase [Gaiellaceae bacterium]